MRPILLGALVLLAPLAAAGSTASEVDILGDYLATFDSPAPHDQHCLRTASFATTRDLPTPSVALPGTNALLDHHLHWHLARYSVMEDGRPPLDPDDSYGTEFVEYHRVKLAEYDAWREARGHAPVAAWAPATPVPVELRYDLPGCERHKTEDPQIALPRWATLAGGDAEDELFGKTALCEFDTLNEFAKALDWGYHTPVHSAVGGDMGPVWTSPRDPLFWAWHRHIDDVFLYYEAGCTGADVMSTARAEAVGEGERAVPGVVGGWIIGAGAAAMAGKRSRAVRESLQAETVDQIARGDEDAQEQLR